MLKVLAIDHIVLRTDKLDAMLNFYRDILGCKVERELPPETGLIQLRAGTTLIDLVPVDSELGRLGGKPPQQDGRNLEHFCLLVQSENQQTLHRYLSSHNLTPEPFQKRYGATGFGPSTYIKHPQGNTLELKLAPNLHQPAFSGTEMSQGRG